MGNWRIIGEGRGFDGDDSMDQELEKAYKEGCRHGYQKAMEKMNGDDDNYGERGYSNSNPYASPGSNYGERDGMYSESYGERQGVKGTGPYSRYRRRRYY